MIFVPEKESGLFTGISRIIVTTQQCFQQFKFKRVSFLAHFIIIAE